MLVCAAAFVTIQTTASFGKIGTRTTLRSQRKTMFKEVIEAYRLKVKYLCVLGELKLFYGFIAGFIFGIVFLAVLIVLIKKQIYI